MIDTIVITLTKDKYQIRNPDKFTPSARWTTVAHAPKGMRSIQNPTKRELLNGIYKPRLTLSNQANAYGMPQQMLKIQLSLPKLIYGNNFDELQYKDFQRIILKLQKTLEQMGITTSIDILAHAPVSAIHYSKNIALTDGSTPYHYIQKIKEANVGLPLDVNETNYRNMGHSYRWHCNAYEVVFYDKIKDLEQACKSSKRVLEKDSALQLSFLNELKKRKMFEVLRIEVRLNKRQKIKQLFKKLGIKSDLTFKKLFKPAISKKILLHYLDEIENKRPALHDYVKTSTKSFLAIIKFNNPKLSIGGVFRSLGLKYALESATLRELRNLFTHSSKKSWYRLMSDVRAIKLPIKQLPLLSVREKLKKFAPLRWGTFRKYKF